MISRRAAQSMLPSSKPLPQRGRRAAAAIPSGAKCLRALRIGFEGKDPAPGNRGSEHGKVRSVGNSGYSGSSTLTGSGAYNLGFNPTWLGSQNYGNRVYGFQLRCLQE